MEISRLKPLYTREDIRKRVEQLGEQITKKYGDEPLVVVCVLKGAFIFFADLVRCIDNKNMIVDFIRLSSYGNGTESSGHVTFSRDVEVNIEGKHVLIVEDCVDSGHTMHFLMEQFRARNPRSLELAALVDKKARRVVDVHVDYPGFVMDDGFIVGYGLDYAEKLRTLPDICIPDEN